MRRGILLMAALIVLAIPSTAWCQNSPGGTNPPPQGGGMPPQGFGMQGGNQNGNGQQFPERKAEILQHMNEHLAEIQQRIGCVQAATNPEALRACMPERGEGHGGHP